MLERIPKYTLRKLSVGLASVMIGSGILMSSPKVLADTTSPSESAGTTSASGSTGTGTTSASESTGTGTTSASESTGTGTAVPSSNQNEGNGENQSRTPALGDNHASSGANGLDGVDSIVPDKPSDGGKSTQGNNNPMIYERAN